MIIHLHGIDQPIAVRGAQENRPWKSYWTEDMPELMMFYDVHTYVDRQRYKHHVLITASAYYALKRSIEVFTHPSRYVTDWGLWCRETFVHPARQYPVLSTDLGAKDNSRFRSIFGFADETDALLFKLTYI